LPKLKTAMMAMIGLPFTAVLVPFTKAQMVA